MPTFPSPDEQPLHTPHRQRPEPTEPTPVIPPEEPEPEVLPEPDQDQPERPPPLEVCRVDLALGGAITVHFVKGEGSWSRAPASQGVLTPPRVQAPAPVYPVEFPRPQPPNELPQPSPLESPLETPPEIAPGEYPPEMNF